MAYSLVSLYEDGNLIDAVVATNWVIGKKVYWSNSTFATRDLKQKIPVSEDWPSYDLDRIRFSHDLYEECQSYHFSSASEDEPVKKKTVPVKQVKIPALPKPPQSTRSLSTKEPELEIPSKTKIPKLGFSTSDQTPGPSRSPFLFPTDYSSSSPIMPKASAAKSPRRKTPVKKNSLPTQNILSPRRSPRRETPLKSNLATEESIVSPRRSPRIRKSLSPALTSDSSISFQKSSGEKKNSSKTKTRHIYDSDDATNDESSSSKNGLASISNRLSISKGNKRPNGATYNRSKYPLSDEDFQRKVIKLLVEINNKLDDNQRDASSSRDNFFLPRPCETITDFLEFEKEIRDEEAYKQLSKQLARIGGKNMGNIVKNVLHTVALDEVWVHFNMHGRGASKKRAFKATLTCKAVTSAVLRCSKETKDEVEAVIGRVLKHAPERIK